MSGLAVVLCLHDTTELDFNGQTIQGLGPLSYEAQRVIYLHPTYAGSTDRAPLGILDASMWAREPRNASGQPGGVCESTRWIESYERLAERTGELPETRLAQVDDRESDILALMRPRSLYRPHRPAPTKWWAALRCWAASWRARAMASRA